jgi:hypothetical protein
MSGRTDPGKGNRLIQDEIEEGKGCERPWRRLQVARFDPKKKGCPDSAADVGQDSGCNLPDVPRPPCAGSRFR